MIYMAKKGYPTKKQILKTSVGVTPEGTVCIRLDDFEIDLTPDRAAQLAARLFDKVNALKKLDADKAQEKLPLPQTV